MNRREALTQVRKILEDSYIDDASLEGEILLRHVLGTDRGGLFSDLDKDLTADQAEKLLQLVERRKWGEPSAYITGHREFYGIDFKVDRRALIPRPDTELLVEKAIGYYREFGFSSVADIGTGCGCIAISLASNLPDAKIYATDASLPALEIAEENGAVHGMKKRISFLWGDFLKPLPEPVDMIVANLPYVRKEDMVSGYEPERALNGGRDGLDAIKAFIARVPGKLNSKGMLLLEIGQGQADSVKDILRGTFSNIVLEVARDLAGIERVVIMRLTS